MPPSYVPRLSEAQNHYCCYCHHPMVLHAKLKPGDVVPRDMLTKDHYIPRFFGGPTTKENLVAACGQCNWIRGSMEAEAFYHLLQHWFNQDPALHKRWHQITMEEFHHFRRECVRIEHIQWRRRVQKCTAATILFALHPHPHYAERAI